MAQVDLKEGITLEVLETETAPEAECSSGACGCGCGSAEEGSEQPVAVVAGGTDDACCEPGCSPETCGGS